MVMNSLLLAVDDGIANANYNWADVFFLVGAILAVFAGIAYAMGVTGTVSDPPHRGFHLWAPALVALAVGFTAFGLFLL